MKVTFKYNGHLVSMQDGFPVSCNDDLTREYLEELMSIKAIMLAGDVTQSPMALTLLDIWEDVDELQTIETETIY